MFNINRAYVISGGGAKGAWAGGLIQQFIEERNYDWDIFIGTSTGSLLVSLIPLKKMSLLKELYTSVNNNNIFSVNPFNKRGNIKLFNSIYRFINKKTSLGETKKLFNLIKNNFSNNDFKKIRDELNKSVYVCVANYTKNAIEYYSNKLHTYDEYILATWASTSVPLFSDMVEINNNWYLDGGVLMHVPIQKAIDEGATEIDVIILRPEKDNISNNWKASNMFDVLLRTIDMMQNYISETNVLIGELKAQYNDVKIRLRYLPYKLTDNSLMFDKNIMLKWWEDGYNYGKLENQSKKIIIKK